MALSSAIRAIESPPKSSKFHGFKTKSASLFLCQEFQMCHLSSSCDSKDKFIRTRKNGERPIRFNTLSNCFFQILSTPCLDLAVMAVYL